MDQAVDLNASGFAVLSGLHPGKDKENEAVDALVKSLKELCAEGKKKNLKIVLETFEKDVKKQLRLVGPSALAAQVATRVKQDHDNFGIMLDLSHLPLLREGSEKAIRDVGAHLVHAHVGSCVCEESHPNYGDTHPPFGVPGSVNSVREVVAYLRALWDSGFFKRNDRPIVSFEVSPRDGENPDVVLAGAKRVFREAWASAF
jgi:sugar phosphate isomerase/epimerase